MISTDLLVCFTAPPKLNPTTGVCYAAKQFLALLRVPFLFNGARPLAWHLYRNTHESAVSVPIPVASLSSKRFRRKGTHKFR